ncbi:hypothetical protein [Halioxenophilus sp. WMMB6]|uniref:hypothetical protein n=1 Tax=Halioxenophilus sp. WMMB6 TaxID=3073815 RepID=UPI00295E2F15|nr:hypothetical protein [Halioxenophilus sp. WMMB6]
MKIASLTRLAKSLLIARFSHRCHPALDYLYSPSSQRFERLKAKPKAIPKHLYLSKQPQKRWWQRLLTVSLLLLVSTLVLLVWALVDAKL